MESVISGNWITLLNNLIEEGKLNIHVLKKSGLSEEKILQVLNGKDNIISAKDGFFLGDLAMAIEFGISNIHADNIVISKLRDLIQDGFTEEMLAKIFQITSDNIRELMEGKLKDINIKYDLAMKIDYLHGYLHIYK